MYYSWQNSVVQIIFLGATFNVCTSVKEIESPLSDEIQNDLQETQKDQISPAFSSFSIDKDKHSLGNKITGFVIFEEHNIFWMSCLTDSNHNTNSFF